MSKSGKNLHVNSIKYKGRLIHFEPVGLVYKVPGEMFFSLLFSQNVILAFDDTPVVVEQR